MQMHTPGICMVFVCFFFLMFVCFFVMFVLCDEEKL